MPRRSKRIKARTQSGGIFHILPRKNVSDILTFFTIFEVARLHRYVCKEFRDAGQARIEERGGRKLYEESEIYFDGFKGEKLNIPLSKALLLASQALGCKIAFLDEMSNGKNSYGEILSDEEKLNVLKECKVIALKKPAYAVAQDLFGDLYLDGYGGETNKDKASVWYTKAAEKGHIGATYSLAVCYNNGEGGVEVDESKAIKLYEVCASAGYSKGRYELGSAYENGEGGLEVNIPRAVGLYKESAEQGDEVAQYRLGQLYMYGTGDSPPETISTDESTAVKWTKLAADQKNDRALYEMGYFFYTGYGEIEQNYDTAFQFFIKSSNQGSEDVFDWLGLCYEEGIGVSVDLEESLKWYRKYLTHLGDNVSEEVTESIRRVEVLIRLKAAWIQRNQMKETLRALLQQAEERGEMDIDERVRAYLAQ